MDDMKQLIEKYKRELIEYSRSSVVAPKPQLEFPEMINEPAEIPDQPEVQVVSEPAQIDTDTTIQQEMYSEPTGSARREPRIIGTVADNDVLNSFGDVFAELYDKAGDVVEQETEGVSTVTPEEAERLDDVPQSGEDDDEKLAKRDFSEDQPQDNDPDDIAPLEQQGERPDIPTERNYSSLQEYTDLNERRGSLRFRTYTARAALPVAGARVVVSKDIGGRKHVFYSLTTDSSGLTQVMSLPAPPKELSETPDSSVQPYALYNAEVSAVGYNDVLIRDIPVFEGVLSLQKVAMVPELGQQTEVITEQEPDLNGGA